MVLETIGPTLAPLVAGFGAGAGSAFIQFWTKLKDTNNDGVLDWQDFDFVRFGKTIVVAGVSSAYLQSTGIVLDPLWAGVLGAGSEKVLRILYFKIQQWIPTGI